MPIGNVSGMEGGNGLNDRGFPSLLMTIGHLKAGVTKEQAIDDLNSFGSYLEKTYPKTDAHMRFSIGTSVSLWRLRRSWNTGISHVVDAAGRINSASRLR